MNILKELKSKFNSTEPIFDYELKSLGYTDKDISDTLKENEFEEIDIDKSFCIPCKAYTLVDYIEMFDMYSKVYGKSEQLIYKYYIGNNYEYGYLDGFCSLNILGFSTQVCGIYNIKSVRVTKGLTIRKEMWGYNIEKSEVNNKLKEQMYINAFRDYKGYFDISIEQALKKLESDKSVDLDYINRRIKEDVIA